MSKDLVSRFWEKVNKTDSCWIWTASRCRDGYGQIGLGSGKGQGLAHRLSFQWAYGDIPKGAYVLHQCDNPPCVNPKHLYTGSQYDNMKDMVMRKRFSNVRGQNNPRAKLTSDDVLKIRQLVSHNAHHNGLSLFDISKIYGVSKSTIALISRNITWRESSHA